MIDYPPLYEWIQEYKAYEMQPELQAAFHDYHGREIMKVLPELVSQSLKWEQTRDHLTHLIARFGPGLDARAKAELAANVRILFALEELSIPSGWPNINFQVWKDGKCYQEPADMVTGVFETLLSHMEKIAPSAKRVMEDAGKWESHKVGRDNFVIETYAEMLYAYSGGRSWADMSNDRNPWAERAEAELKGLGMI